MLFMVNIVVRLPGDWPKEKVESLASAETARGMQCISEGKLKRIFRVVGQRANFSIWEAASPEALHATLASLPMHPYMEVSVDPIIKHSTTEAWEAAHGAMPAFLDGWDWSHPESSRNELSCLFSSLSIAGEIIMTRNEKSQPTSGTAGEPRYAILPDRMPPIPMDKMTDAQRKVAAEIIAGPRGKVEGPYVPIIRSPGLTESLQKVGEYYRYRCPLDRKINEMAALMAARSWSQQFIWDVHILQALDAGLKNDIALAIAEGRRPAGMAEDEEILYDFVTELLANKGVSDPTYARAAARFGEPGIVDILGILGYYSTLAMIMNVARTPLLEGRPFPLAPTPLRLHPLASTPLRGR